MALAGGEGAHLATAVTWLGAHADAYARTNPSCWSRVIAARDGIQGPLVVMPFAVGDRTAPPDDVATSGIVIDGLHRALGWGLRPDVPLEAFIPATSADQQP